MTTPPHIEAAARAILKMDGSHSDRDIDMMRDGGSFVYSYILDEAALVWNLARKATLEEAAKEADAEDERCKQKAKTSQSYEHDWMMCACTSRLIGQNIRALAPVEGKK